MHTPYCHGNSVPLIILPAFPDYDVKDVPALESATFAIALRRGEVLWISGASTEAGSECAMVLTLTFDAPIAGSASMVVPLTTRAPAKLVMPHNVTSIAVTCPHAAKVAMWRAERAAPSDILPRNAGGTQP